MKKVNIGTIQLSCVKEVEINFTKTKEAIRQAAKKGAQIICLQELFRSLYFCDEAKAANFDLAEDIYGQTSQELQVLAKELNVVIIASLFEKRAVGIYHNTTVVLDADATFLGKYRKTHIPDDPGFCEKY